MRVSSSRRLVGCLAACIATVLLAACGKSSPGNAAPAVQALPSPSTPTADVATRVPADPDSPCHLLTDAEVRAVLSGPKRGERERTREQYGITACQWSGDRGRFLAQIWSAKEHSAEDEIRGLANGFVDPMMPGAADHVRYEPVSGVGEQVFAVIESQNATRGILNDAAMLVARKHDRILMLVSDDLAHRDRAEVLAALQSLGRSAVGRL